jgi:hypothetical protein
MAETPARTSAGVLGIARTTAWRGSEVSSVASVTPAAIERIVAPSASAGAALSSAEGTSWCFTATTTTSASGTAHAGLGTTWTPGKAVSSTRRRSASTSATARASDSHPASSSPATRASPMRPPPNSATRFMKRSVGEALRPVVEPHRDAEGPEELRLRAHFPERTRPRHLGPASIRARRVRTAGLGGDTLSHPER